MDPGRIPLWVFLAHPLNEVAQATIDLRAPCPISGFPAPEGFEARAMPPQDRLRLNLLGHAEQARPEPGHPYQQRPVTATQSKTRRRTPQRDAELMTKKKVFGFKPQPRLEHGSRGDLVETIDRFSVAAAVSTKVRNGRRGGQRPAGRCDQ